MKTYTAKELLSPSNSALLNEIILVLSHAFSEDPPTKWLFSNHSRQEFVNVVPKYMGMVTRLALESDASVMLITKDDLPATKTEITVKEEQAEEERPQIILPPDSTIRAVAVLIPPQGNAIFDSMGAMFRAGLLMLPFVCGPSMTWRLLTEMLSGFHKMHEDMFPDPSTKYHNWHLLFLATHPDSRGKGVGRRMLTDIKSTVRQINEVEARIAKAKGEIFVPAPLYLEASSAVNKRLYSRVGFEEKSDMIYGKVNEGEDLVMGKDGSVIGGRSFGMVWKP